MMHRRSFISRTLRSVFGLIAVRSPFLQRLTAGPLRSTRRYGEILYNGIEPPLPFPPVLEQPWSTDEKPYYLVTPPEPIRIDVGRQLFVDDFLIESGSGIETIFHQPSAYDQNPVFWPTDEQVHSWTGNDGFTTETQLACPFSDGVWWDTTRQKFRAWYLGGPNTLRLAESEDGLEWTRIENDGVVMSIPGERDSGTVWIDGSGSDPSQRYKMSFFSFRDKLNWIHASADGVHWPASDDPIVRSQPYASNPQTPTGDRSTFFYNPFRNKWVWSLRDIRDQRSNGGLEHHRMRRYQEGDDLFETSQRLESSGYWVEADAIDLAESTIDLPSGTIPQLYNLDAFAYESVMIFGLSILKRNALTDRDAGESLPKRNEVHLGFSRDGFYMARPSTPRVPFIPIGASGSWNEGNVQTVGGGCVIVGEKESERLRFYFSGRRNDLLEDGTLQRFGHLGCADLRRDGFTSIESVGMQGILTTRILQFTKPRAFLFVNVDAAGGDLRVELLDPSGQPIAGFERSSAIPVSDNSTLRRVEWTNRAELSELAGSTFRMRFYLRDTKLYSFWISGGEDGSSDGFLAAGGPRYEDYRDVGPPDTTRVSHLPRPRSQSPRVSPNPVTSISIITYVVQTAGEVRIDVYDAEGRNVRRLLSQFQASGLHEVRFDRNGLAPGVYFCRIHTSNQSESVKVTVATSGQ